MNPSLQTLPVRHKPKIDLLDERVPLCLSRSQVKHCFFRRAAVRACSDNAAEHRRNRQRHYGRIELDRADQHGGENGPAAYHGDPAGQDKFAAAFNFGGELIDLRLKPYNLVAMVAVVHGASLVGVLLTCVRRWSARRYIPVLRWSTNRGGRR